MSVAILLLIISLVLICLFLYYIRIFEQPVSSLGEFGSCVIVYEPRFGHYKHTFKLLHNFKNRLSKANILTSQSFAIFYDHPKEATNSSQWTSVIGYLVPVNQHNLNLASIPDQKTAQQIHRSIRHNVVFKKKSNFVKKKKLSFYQNNSMIEINNDGSDSGEGSGSDNENDHESNADKKEKKYIGHLLSALKNQGFKALYIPKIRVAKAVWKSDRPLALWISLSLKISAFLKWAKFNDYKIGHMMELYDGKIGSSGSTISYLLAQEHYPLFHSPESFIISKKHFLHLNK
ncbi:hypothetical protein M0813_00673 [Anaeramoeba flamelloides]|uniref:Uncharacterized protein n=1 Tax=Anaeramoeba flamelloides TaxID=1746091 RepID=A0ABQ8XNL8_9EUKA|nr:hypothetical protein M0813_00673 [Anaeramoeba flamelloides]